MASNARQAWDEARELVKRIGLTAGEIEDSRRRQEQIRKPHQQAIGKFSEVYSQLIRAAMGKSLSAGVEFYGRSIALSLDYHGKLTSAAIESIKWERRFIPAATAGFMADPKDRLPQYLHEIAFLTTPKDSYFRARLGGVEKCYFVREPYPASEMGVPPRIKTTAGRANLASVGTVNQTPPRHGK